MTEQDLMLEENADWAKIPSDLMRIEEKLDKVLVLLNDPDYEEKLDLILANQNKPKKTNSRKAHEYTPDFEEIWDGYPTRAGTNSKQKAFTAYRMRQLEGVSLTEMQSGVGRYFEYCRLTDKLKTEYVMAASRFFGSGREYENEWIAPKKEKKILSDQDWIDAGEEKDIYARAGESMVELKRRIQVALR